MRTLGQWAFERVASLPRVRDPARTVSQLLELGEGAMLALLQDESLLVAAAARVEAAKGRSAGTASLLNADAPVFQPSRPNAGVPLNHSSQATYSSALPFATLVDPTAIAEAIAGPLRQEFLGWMCALQHQMATCAAPPPLRSGGRQRRTMRTMRRVRRLGIICQAYVGEEQSMRRFVAAASAHGILYVSDVSSSDSSSDEEYFSAEEPDA